MKLGNKHCGAEENMHHNLCLYHKVLAQLKQWLPDERITRLRNMALVMTGLYASMSIHLSKIVSEWPLGGQLVSLTNRLRRWLSNRDIQVRDWYRPMAQQLVAALAQERIRLVMDVTKVGAQTRMLMMGLAYRKRVVPLGWRILRGRKGHASEQVQIDLLREISPLLPAGVEVWVLADAGFQSVKVLRWLCRQGWHFAFRQPGNVMLYPAGDKGILFNAVPVRQGQTVVLGWVRFTLVHRFGWLWAVVHWESAEDDPWFLISDVPDTRRLLRLYACRMWIEETYGDMKGHGFDLEATHLTDLARLSRLLLAVCLTFVWFIALGSWVVKRGLRFLIDRKDRRDKSYFRLGWDWLQHAKRNQLPVPVRFVPIL
jgi:hypothetical protein